MRASLILNRRLSWSLLHAAGPFASLLLAATASAQTVPRVQVSQNGDFLLVGNTLGQNCTVEPDTIVVGSADLTLAGCGKDSDSGADLFWRSDAPGEGQATASLTNASADAGATAVLTVPPGATVTHAYLFWSAMGPLDDVKTTGIDESAPDGIVTLSRPGAGGFTEEVKALPADRKLITRKNRSYYQCGADVGDLVRVQGSGAYRLSGVTAFDFRNKTEDTAYAGFWLVLRARERAAPESRPLRHVRGDRARGPEADLPRGLQGPAEWVQGQARGRRLRGRSGDRQRHVQHHEAVRRAPRLRSEQLLQQQPHPVWAARLHRGRSAPPLRRSR